MKARFYGRSPRLIRRGIPMSEVLFFAMSLISVLVTGELLKPTTVAVDPRTVPNGLFVQTGIVTGHGIGAGAWHGDIAGWGVWMPSLQPIPIRSSNFEKYRYRFIIVQTSPVGTHKQTSSEKVWRVGILPPLTHQSCSQPRARVYRLPFCSDGLPRGGCGRVLELSGRMSNFGQ